MTRGHDTSGIEPGPECPGACPTHPGTGRPYAPLLVSSMCLLPRSNQCTCHTCPCPQVPQNKWTWSQGLPPPFCLTPVRTLRHPHLDLLLLLHYHLHLHPSS
uniref:Uncharacterized protein n=1 Tax=Cacopsylla melanoneura TaxID=428564 RepID=A0A8D8VC00_9HEMI